ncbi:MAG: 50S ribosomal protein L21 [Micavibrio sp.]|nr:50S ribosomal protein L21 [Micavibrio sp.]|tara:strand:- start:1012 stop:1329 length:318 start_codon:yes stop_codon:yes gene_type:complete
MYAIVKTGGKQYRVSKDDTIQIEKIEGDAGAKVTFDEVLFLGDDKKQTMGEPLVKGASVTGEIINQYREDKIIVFKKKRRQNYRRKAGHKQHKTLVKITAIKAAA